jgi:predicted RNase H-like HicB family nuclease
MQLGRFIYLQEGDAWLGYLQEYSDYWTQGESIDDLHELLQDLHVDLMFNGMSAF